MVVGAGLCFLGRKHVKSIANVFGMSESSVIRVVNNFLVAVHSKSEIKIPYTASELSQIADSWNMLSTANGIFYGAVGAVDGWLATIEKLSLVPNPTDYFSGHYQYYGINVQAVCDSNLRLIYFAVTGPGRTNNSRVFDR